MTVKKVVVKNSLHTAIDIKIAKTYAETGEKVTVAELSETFGEYAGASPTALILIKANNYVPSLYIAFKLAKFLDEKLENLFELCEEDD